MDQTDKSLFVAEHKSQPIIDTKKSVLLFFPPLPSLCGEKEDEKEEDDEEGEVRLSRKEMPNRLNGKQHPGYKITAKQKQIQNTCRWFSLTVVMRNRQKVDFSDTFTNSFHGNEVRDNECRGEGNMNKNSLPAVTCTKASTFWCFSFR